MGSNKYLITLGGPTATGKTELSILLAQHFNTAIISADSRQIYKELHIGVAKPTDTQLKTVPHYFISHISIFDKYSAYEYQKEVHQVLKKLFKEKDVVVMVGGTGFYINAVLNGLNEIPSISAHTKDYIQMLYEQKGLSFLQKELIEKDPQYAQKIDMQNPVRIMRALEVIYETGQPFTAFLNNQLIQKPDYFIPINIWINISRPILNQRIEERVRQMIDAGLEQEAQMLYPFRHLQALNTVGYKEWWKYFEGNKIKRESMIGQIQKNTRHYAKRQITWFKHQWAAEEIKFSPTYLSIHQAYTTILQHIEKKITTSFIE